MLCESAICDVSGACVVVSEVRSYHTAITLSAEQGACCYMYPGCMCLVSLYDRRATTSPTTSLLVSAMALATVHG